jgi:hypothetical protein
VPSAYLRVVTTPATGATRALNHFNKHAKGALVRRLAQDRPAHRDGGADGVGERRGTSRAPGAPGELDLVV